jgi:cytochrome P450
MLSRSPPGVSKGKRKAVHDDCSETCSADQSGGDPLAAYLSRRAADERVASSSVRRSGYRCPAVTRFAWSTPLIPEKPSGMSSRFVDGHDVSATISRAGCPARSLVSWSIVASHNLDGTDTVIGFRAKNFVAVSSSLAHTTIDSEVAAYFEAELLDDPYPFFRRLREQSPIHRFGSTVVVSPYSEVKGIYRDAKRFQKHPARVSGLDNEFALLSEADLVPLREIMEFETAFISRKNGADHSRVRSAVGRYFTPKRIAALEAQVEHIVDELLDPLGSQDVVDLSEFAFRLPLLVVMELLGAPRQDADRLKRWGDSIQRPASRSPKHPEDVHEAYEGLVEYRAYSQALVERHRRDPNRNELVETLLNAEEGQQLTEHELVAFFLHTMFAGHETTANLIANGLVALLANRSEWERLCADPLLIDSAVEELLRYDSPVQFGIRLAACDVAIEGVTAPAGSTIIIMIAGANRDAQNFEEPDRLDITRQPNDHLALAFGPHYCLGASVARLEGRLALGALAARYPQLQLAIEPEQLRRNRHVALRGFQSLPVRLGGSSV